MMEQVLLQAAERIRVAKYLTAFSGAGISVESGIPPFRGPGGIWNKYDPAILDLDVFIRQPERARKAPSVCFSVRIEASCHDTSTRALGSAFNSTSGLDPVASTWASRDLSRRIVASCVEEQPIIAASIRAVEESMAAGRTERSMDEVPLM